MGSKELLLKIETSVSKSLTPESISIIKDDDFIKTVKIVSDAFIGKSLSSRLQMTLAPIRLNAADILVDFDLTFVLVSKSENQKWTDYEELNNKLTSTPNNRQVAKDL